MTFSISEGYLPFLTENLHLDLIELGKKYGDVFSLSLGSQNIVILHGADTIKEAFAKPELLGRPPNADLEIVNPSSSFFSSDVHAWKEQRRFVVQAMKDLGLGRTKIEADIMDEIHYFLEVLENTKGRPIDVKMPLSPSMSNNISALIFGKRYEYDDQDRQMLDRNLEQAHESFGLFSLYTLFPWIRYIPFAVKLIKVNKSVEAADNIRRFF
ncbi:cytochrome P450 2K4, partial [Trichonephila clavata]